MDTSSQMSVSVPNYFSYTKFWREVSTADKMSGVLCKMGKGWTCVVTKTEGPDAGKVFIKCSENCTCTIEGEVVSREIKLPYDVVSGSESETFCKCGEGWSCVISKIEGPDAGSGKGFADCAGQCSCNVACC